MVPLTPRAFGPAVISGLAPDQWIYWAGGLGGGLLAAALYIVLKAVKYWYVKRN